MEDLDKFSIGDFFIKMEKLDRKQRIGLTYRVLDKLKQDKVNLEDEFCTKNKSIVSLNNRRNMHPTRYIDLILISSRIKEIDSYIQKVDSYLDELLKV